MKVIFVSGEITYQMAIRCHSCGRMAFSKHRMTLRQCRTTLIHEEIQYHFNRTTPDIPVGWSMMGRDKISCVFCK